MTPMTLSWNSWQQLINQQTNLSLYNPQTLLDAQQVVTKRWQTPHGDSKKWQACWQQLMDLVNTNTNPIDPINQTAPFSANLPPQLQLGDCITLPVELSATEQKLVETVLQGLHPWRKGPFAVGSVFIDSEWQSQLKWQRIKDANIDLTGANVLDIGCGNGYYAWRMLEQGANSVLGVESSLLLHYQFALFKTFAPTAPIILLPMRFEQLPLSIAPFDRVFSMGVLGHHKQPLQHLTDIKKITTPQGKLILETLIVEDETLAELQPKSQTELQPQLQPRGRYAQMNNVYCLPTPTTLLQWLEQTGWRHPTIHSIVKTSFNEQRSTAWMRNQSLKDFLNPQNPKLTIEGHPAPVRILVEASNG